MVDFGKENKKTAAKKKTASGTAAPDYVGTDLFDPETAQPFGWDESAFNSMGDLALFLTQKGENCGKFSYGGDHIGSDLDMVMVGKRMYRRFFGKKYDSLVEGEENHVVCRSHDGFEGFGTAAFLNVVPKPWRDHIENRVCAERTPGGRLRDVCPMADSFQCPPRMRLLVLIRWAEVDQWMPAFYDVHGVQFKPVRAAWGSAFRKHEFSKRPNKAGQRVPTAPIWLWKFAIATFKPKANRDGWAPSFHGPDPVLNEDHELINHMVREQLLPMWKADGEDAKEVMLAVGQEKKTEETNEPEQRKPSSGGEPDHGQHDTGGDPDPDRPPF